MVRRELVKDFGEALSPKKAKMATTSELTNHSELANFLLIDNISHKHLQPIYQPQLSPFEDGFDSYPPSVSSQCLSHFENLS